MNVWVIKDKIKKGIISFNIGDEVSLFWRKGNGYPRTIMDGEICTVSKVENDYVYVRKHSSDGVGWLSPIRVHKTYLIPIQTLRDIKLKLILNDDNI